MALAVHTRTTQESTDGRLVADPRDGTSVLSDSHAVVREMDGARGKSLLGGLFTLLRANFDAWMEEGMQGTIMKRLEIRAVVAKKHTETIQAETGLRGSVVAGMTDDQKRMLEFNTARRQRLLSDLQVAAGNAGPIVIESSAPSVPPVAPLPPVAPHMTREQIDAFALKAVMNLGTGGEDDEEWAAYRTELYKKLPQNLAQEVEQRIRELWSTLT